MTVRAKGGRGCVHINGIALEAHASEMWEDDGTPFEIQLIWKDAVRLRDALTEAIGEHEKEARE